MKVSEAFEGEESSLRKTFDESTKGTLLCIYKGENVYEETASREVLVEIIRNLAHQLLFSPDDETLKVEK